MMMRHLSYLRDAERGVGIIVMFGVIMLLIYFCALVIDLGRAEFTTHGIQRSVDAAALAAASELVLGTNDDLVRWRNAKRAALAVLKLNPIDRSVEIPDIAVSANHQGDTDYCESSGYFRSQIFDNGEMRVEIERGVYTEDAVGPVFTSLESEIVCNAYADPYPNAVQVTLTIYDYPNFFAIVLPFATPNFPMLTRQAIGAEVD